MNTTTLNSDRPAELVVDVLDEESCSVEWRSRFVWLVYVIVLLVEMDLPWRARADDSNLFGDFNSNSRSNALETVNSSDSGTFFTTKSDPTNFTSMPDSSPVFGKIRQSVDESIARRFPSQVDLAVPSEAPHDSLFKSNVRTIEVDAPLSDSFQLNAASAAGSQSASLLRGIVSHASCFPSANDSCDLGDNFQLTNAMSLLPNSQSGSAGSGVTCSIPPQLYHYPSAPAGARFAADTSIPTPSLLVNTVSDNMVDDAAIKQAVGGPSGFFSAARLQWKLDSWRLESGVGFAWNMWLDSAKPLLDFNKRENVVWNMSLLYYPCSDLPWQPFALLGTGVSQLNSLGVAPENSASAYVGVSHKR